MEVIKEQICKTTYKGNCPECGEEQIASNKRYVDIECYKCENKEIVIQIKNDLLGLIITDIKFDGADIESIILKRLDNKLVKLEIEHNWDAADEFYYSIFDENEKK